jgi:hypothetical protein
MSENENIKKTSNKFIEEELKNRPMSMFLGVIESEIMDYLGIVGNYFTLDDSKKEKVDVVKSAILSNPNVIQKEIHLQEELEEDPFLDYIWVIHKDTPSEDIMKTVRDWNDSMLNDPDLDWDPFDLEKERLK